MEITDWNYIIELIKDNKIDKIVELCTQLQCDEQRVIKSKLILELQSTNDKNYRNTIALVLGDLKCDDAIDIIIDIINNPKYSNCIGTLVYVLRDLNCEKAIKKIIPRLFDGNFEVKCNMYDLLLEKFQYMCDEDKEECIKKIEDERTRIEDELELLDNIEENIFGF